MSEGHATFLQIHGEIDQVDHRVQVFVEIDYVDAAVILSKFEHIRQPNSQQVTKNEAQRA